ncbi:MAG TPA: TPM domain-containing protein [Saprospiraceae bacterium]|nr:TPM domain-containing protein [Saprospiraceae bacterium]
MLFTKAEEARIVETIRQAERGTSGEIRLYVEDFCLKDHPVEQAAELFQLFGMHHTKDRNAVLIYLAQKSHHFAIWGDAGIHEKVGHLFWEEEKKILKAHFQQDMAAEGVCQAIRLIGDRLRAYFPAADDNNENELPDEIIYG